MPPIPIGWTEKGDAAYAGGGMPTAICSVLIAAALALPPGQPSATHSKEFWQGIAERKFAVPHGEATPALADELVGLLGSTDPVLRDELAVSILTSWIYRQKLLGPDELRRITRTLQDNLRAGIGAAPEDGVLRRSFSALTLSIVAARENEAPFLSEGEYRALLDAAIAYLRDETDLRGYDTRRGWMHSAAHTSDLLKFLARHPRFTPADQARVLAALTAKNRTAASAFAHGEDERMARVIVSIARRADFDREAFGAWLAAAQAAATFPQTPTPDTLRAQQNVRHLLTSAFAELSVDDRPSEGADFARAALRGALKAIGF